MNQEEFIGRLESILFAAGDGVEIDRLCEYFQMEKEELLPRLEEEATRRKKEYGLILMLYGNQVQLGTRPEYQDMLFSLFGKEEEGLSQAMLETLSIIAYRQPVTRGEIEMLRGVNSSYMMHALLNRDLITCVGLKETVGRPKLFGTTERFLRCFGLRSLRDLPPLEEEPFA